MNEEIITIIDHLPTLTEQEFSQKLNAITEQRRKKVMSYKFRKDQILCLESYLLLKESLENNYGIDGNQLWEFGSCGKPRLSNYPEIHFNLSHCDSGIACAVSNKPIGIDIESIPLEIDDELCRFCFSEEEYRKIIQSSNPCLAFAKLWTRKESFLKLLGTGIEDNIKIILSSDLVRTVSFTSGYSLYKGFCYSICRFCGEGL